MQARIYEQGNGFPDTGDYVPGNDGLLYLVTGESFGPIQTGDNRGNWLLVYVELAEWTDCTEEEIFPALCVPVTSPETWLEYYCSPDSVDGLEAGDIRRCLLDRPAEVELDAMAECIVQQRPDLVDEVQDVLAELRGVAE